jgi:hypothetical protein
MGTRRRAVLTAVSAAVVLAAARAEGSVQVEPIARLTLEGGYDSNVMYDGTGGDAVQRVSPELGVALRDHTWAVTLDAGGDLLSYRQRNTTVWNQRGLFAFAMRPEERWDVAASVTATYAADPIGLARLGIFGKSGAAFILKSTGRATWLVNHDWKLSFLFAENMARFDDGTGAVSNAPGVQLLRRVSERLELGGQYKLNVFTGIGPGADVSLANEAAGVLRWRWTHHLTVEADAGPALWSGKRQADGTRPPPVLIPEGGVQLIAHVRENEARLSYRHGVGLGTLITPGLFDAAEGAFTLRFGRAWHVHADGGLWRSGDIPWGANAVLGYGLQGEVGWRSSSGWLVALGASRFANADGTSTKYDRNTVGLRVGWELRRRGGD